MGKCLPDFEVEDWSLNPIRPDMIYSSSLYEEANP